MSSASSMVRARLVSLSQGTIASYSSRWPLTSGFHRGSAVVSDGRSASAFGFLTEVDSACGSESGDLGFLFCWTGFAGVSSGPVRSGVRLTPNSSAAPGGVPIPLTHLLVYIGNRAGAKSSQSVTSQFIEIMQARLANLNQGTTASCSSDWPMALGFYRGRLWRAVDGVPQPLVF